MHRLLTAAVLLSTALCAAAEPQPGFTVCVGEIRSEQITVTKGE